MSFTKEGLIEGLKLLAAVYGDDFPVFSNTTVADVWFKFFSRHYSSDARFMEVIEHYITVIPFFPRVPNEVCKAWDTSGEHRPPGETWLDQKNNGCAVLASEEMKERERVAEDFKNMTPEKMRENVTRMKLISSIVCDWGVTVSKEERKMRIKEILKAPLHELDAIAKTCKDARKLKTVTVGRDNRLQASSNSEFEDMHKYFHSGSERYRQLAIDWCDNPKNGCTLVRSNGKVIDIKEIEF